MKNKKMKELPHGTLSASANRRGMRGNGQGGCMQDIGVQN
jgi:hypothetical protein